MTHTNMNDRTVALIELLASMKPLKAEQSKSWLAAKMHKVLPVFQWVSVGLFCSLVFLVAPAFIWPEVRTNHMLRHVVLVMGAISIACATTWLFFEVLALAESIVFLQRDASKRQLRVATHDLAYVQKLATEELLSLQITKQWICIEMDRFNARLATLFGAPDKIALFSLAALAWSTWKETGTIATGWVNVVVQFVLAFLGGAVIGSILLKARLSKLTYQRDLLSLAISLAEAAHKKLPDLNEGGLPAEAQIEDSGTPPTLIAVARHTRM